ncbi:MAG: hypothetical protein FWF75_00135 [Propionibacteriaceae bacterium]|nr:hypothetical protein [Propionibacteriaceae bacterium]
MGLFGRKTNRQDEDGAAEDAVRLADPPAPQIDGLRNLDAHRAWVLSQITPLAPLGLGLVDATGLTLDEELRAEAECPATDQAAVSGFAVAAAGLGDAAARRAQEQGAAPAAPVVPIYAGQPLPEGADTVIPDWMAQPSADGVLRLVGRVRRGDWVRPAGLDAHTGDLLARVGDVMTPALAARLAQCGYDRVIVRPRVRAIVVGFDEPASAAAAGAPHPGLPASYLVAMALRNQGVTAHRIPVAADDADAVRETIGNELIRSDLLVCCGGLEDPASPVLEALDALGLLDVAPMGLEPGGRYAFGLMGEERTPLLGLPGQPLAALIGYLSVVRPALCLLAGSAADPAQTLQAGGAQMLRTMLDLPAPGDVACFVLGRLVHSDGVRPLGMGGLASMAELTAADVIIALPAGCAAVRAGEPVQCWPLGL